MPVLELHHLNGAVDRRELSRRQPLTIGKQSFNDICVEGNDVAPMHCRVLWNKKAFEITAASSKGVEVNGSVVQQHRLQSGDVIHIGDLDLIFVDELTPEPESPAFRLADDEIEFKSADQTEPPRPAPVPKKKPPGKPETVRESLKDDDADSSRPVEDMSLFEGPVYTESQVLASYQPDQSSPDDVSHVKLKPLATSSAFDRSERSVRTGDAEKPRPGDGQGLLLASRARPGEQDILRSPLVLSLTLGGLVLVLISGIFWLLIGREQATRLYDRAVAELNDGQYAQSIASFEQFLQQYPGHSLGKQAGRGLDRARIQKEISGAVPAWKQGLDQLHAMIAHHRNEADFGDLHPVIQRLAEEISLGAARTAETSKDKELLTVSEDAQVLLERFSDPSAPPSAALARIRESRANAGLAIGNQAQFDAGMAAVDAALAAGKPMQALSEREKLVRAFEGISSHKRVKDALQKALELERSVIVRDDTEQAAETMEPAPGWTSVLGLFHTRTRTDEASLGQVAYVQAKDSCYAVDSITGELVWRRVIGFDHRFFPVNVTGAQAGVLMYDDLQQSLLYCQQATGKLIWRQRLEGRPRSAPLIHENQIYLPTDDRSLCRIDVDSGRRTERIRFSQNLQGPPVLTQDGNHLLAPGEMSMIYTLSMRPLAAAAMTFTDHAAGSIAAPPLALGKLYLLCENDKSDSATLRLWDASQPRNPLVELTGKSVRVRGQVREPLVLRGNQLIVPSSGEQLTAFSVTDEAGRESLAPVGQYRVREDESLEKKDSNPSQKPPVENEPLVVPAGTRVPLFVTLGPDRQFWTASSAFRRLEIGADAIHMSSRTVAPGIASQRLQLIGEQFYVGRKLPFHDAVIFSAVDRDRMVIPWRIVLGSQLLQAGSARDGGLVAVSESGHVLMIGPDRLRQGGFDQKAAVELPLPGGIQQRLVTSMLHDGRIFVAADSDIPQVAIVGTGGQIELNAKLGRGESVQTGAILLDEGLAVALPGRLKVIPLTANRKSVQDWLAPAGDRAQLIWKSLTRLDGDEFLACSADGLLMRLQVRTVDVPHVAEVSKLQLPQPVDVAPLVREESLLITLASGAVQLMNWKTFDQEGKRQLTAPIRGAWSVKDSWLITSDGKLQLLAEGRELPIRWSYDLRGREPVGPVLSEQGQVWLACRNGTVLIIDEQTGTEVRQLEAPQSLTSGLRKLDGQIFAIACDGTVYRVPQAEGP